MEGQSKKLTKGVITATDHVLFSCVWANAISLEMQGIPYAVVDHGLLPEQEAILAGHGVILLDDREKEAYGRSKEQLTDLRSQSKIPCRTWHKPKVMLRSPFERTIWCDADALILDAKSAFELGDFAVRDTYTKNHKILDDPIHWRKGISGWGYREKLKLIQKCTGIDLSEENHPYLRINAGVLGYSKDSEWVSDFACNCERIVNDKSLAKLCLDLDQSVLILTLIESEYPNFTLIRDSNFNFPADGIRADGKTARKPLPKNGYEFLEVAWKNNPNAKIIHWMGPGESNKPFIQHWPVDASPVERNRRRRHPRSRIKIPKRKVQPE